MQAAIVGLSPTYAGKVTVVKIAENYVVTFNSSLANVDQLTGELFVGGTVQRPLSPVALAGGLQTSMNGALRDAGVAVTVAVALGTGVNLGKLQITPNGSSLRLRFASAVKAESSGGRIALGAPLVKLTLDAGRPATTITRRVEVDLLYENSAFQELGLATVPTRLHYDQPPAADATDAIEFTLFVNGVEVPVTMSSSTAFDDLGGLRRRPSRRAWICRSLPRRTAPPTRTATASRTSASAARASTPRPSTAAAAPATGSS